MFTKIKSLLSPKFVPDTNAGPSFIEPTLAGTGQLAPVPIPKAPTRPQSVPSFKTQIAKATSAITQTDRRLANTDVTTYRTGSTTQQVLRDMVASSPDLSATLNAYLRVGIPDRYSVIARDMDGAVNVEATRMAQEVLRRITLLNDPSLGYNPTTDLQSMSESLAKELLTYGSMSAELALDKQRMPLFLQPVSVTKLKWKEEDQGVYPIQVIAGQEISLDIATFFYISIDQSLLTPYSSSLFEPAIQAVLADGQFLNDLRRSMQRVIQPRLVATLIEDKVSKTIPPEISNDPTKLKIFYDDLVASLQTMLTDLEPSEALISFDAVDFEMLSSASNGSGNVGDTLTAVKGILEDKLAAGAKSMAAVLGRDAGASSAATSTMLFMKNAGIVRSKLNILYSRILTMAVRLLGQDVFVEFEYADLDLRPQSELEAYKAMTQSRILELLSLGLLTDEEACIKLTGSLPPPGMKPLSGTMFKTASANTGGNPNSQTSTMNGSKDPVQPSTPAAPKN